MRRSTKTGSVASIPHNKYIQNSASDNQAINSLTEACITSIKAAHMASCFKVVAV